MNEKEWERLSPAEREVMGDPAEWEEVEGPTQTYASKRQTSAQFSLRIDREQIQQVRRIAEARDTSFSNIVRDAIRNYVEYVQIVDRSQISTTKKAAQAVVYPVSDSLRAAL